MNENWEKVLADSQLISLPESYIKLQQIISNSDFSLSEITQVISYDPAITARLLRMVNSSFFGLTVRIDTVSHAVNYLGAQQVNDVVLATSIAQTFNDMSNKAFNLHEFWRKSVYCAIASRELAALCHVADGERLFVIGLLHDIGHLMMQQSIPDLTLQTENSARQQGIPLYMAEKDLLDFDSAEMGAQLLKNWNLPNSLTEAIHYQHQPANAENVALEASILNIANRMAHSFSYQLDERKLLKLIDEEAIKRTHLNYEQLDTVNTMSHDNIEDVISLLFPQLK
jgi:HD-like signal output (HDOD) protein